MKKIIVRGPALSRSGYGEQTRFALRCLRHSEKYEVFIFNTDWGKTSYIGTDDEETRWIEHRMMITQKLFEISKQKNQQMEFDVSLQVTIPNEWEQIAPINIGYTAGIESDKIAPVWLEKTNKMDRVILTSNHAKYGFVNTTYLGTNSSTGEKQTLKVNKDVSLKVVNYAVRDVEKVDLNIDFETKTNFLCVAQWGPRKNIQNTVKWFVENFKDNQDVGLVLKLNFMNSSVIDKYRTIKLVEDLVKEYSQDAKCKVYLIHGDMSESEMHSLYTHPQISAMISLTHGEGYGLPLFEAAYNELPIIAPDWSGHMDFLVGKDAKGKSKSLFLNIDFVLNKIQREAVWDGVLQPDSRWCYPQEYSFKKRLNDFIKNKGVHKKRAKLLAAQIRENFSQEKIYQDFIEALKVEILDQSGDFEEVFIV